MPGRRFSTGNGVPVTKPAAIRSSLPRLSEAKGFLPLLRGHLVAAAARRPLAPTFTVVPIVEDELFGYELVPDRETHTGLIIGSNAQGEPVLRRTSYGVDTPDAVRLVAVNGRLLSRSECAARYRVQGRDYRFPSWLAAAEAAWAQLLVIFPDRPRHARAQCADACRFEEALAIAHAHLARWDPLIGLFGLPNEAQLGYVLTGSSGERGELKFLQPGTWTLRWNAFPEKLYESWSVAVDDPEASNERAPRDLGYSDRRADSRRVADRGRFPDRRTGTDRRQGFGRRAVDQRDSQRKVLR